MHLPQYDNNPFRIQLSFEKILIHPEKNTSPDNNVSTPQLHYEAELYKELRNGITKIEDIKNNEALISRLFEPLFPPLLSNNEIKAVSIPYQGLIFNYSKRFRSIIQAAGDDFEISIRNFDDHQFYIFSCCLILNQFYGTNVDFAKPLFCDIPSGQGYMRHYRILYNAEFLEIIPLIEPPDLSVNEVKELLDNYDDLDLWKARFPPETWLLKGFALMTLIDVTTENAVSQLKGDLLGNSDDPNLHLKMESVFRSIFRIANVKIGFTSYDEINSKFRNISFGQQIQSFILTEGNNETDTREIFRLSYEKFANDHTYYTITDVTEFVDNNPQSKVGKVLQSFNIGSFILAPIIKNGIILGFLELASPKRNEFNSVNANRLENLMQFLTDTIDRKIAEFKNRVQAVIQNNYTTLHPSVNWKFEREVHNFIRITELGQGYTLKEIKFKNIYPLYGQVDIQNSSVTRNTATQNDLLYQLSELSNVFRLADIESPDESYKQPIKHIQSLSQDISAGLRSGSEQEIENLTEMVFHPLLSNLLKPSVTLKPIIETYLRQTDKNDGAFYKNRRNYDQTLLLINTTVASVIDKRHEEIQKFFPHYYERFKTDGVEHNLYIGESIYPKHNFNHHHLERLRMWQMLVITEMERNQRLLKGTLPYQLGLTALIVVYSTPINIRFRMDEKHFDLDTAYDIRYEIVKKRIDKAHIKETGLRITEKEKLTIVYAKDEERNDYLRYMKIFQNLKIFSENIEDFEIDDLQGVAGLKALRVGISTELPLSEYTDLYEKVYALL